MKVKPLKAQHFHTKLLCQNQIDRMGSTKWTYHKERGFATISFFLKIEIEYKNLLYRVNLMNHPANDYMFKVNIINTRTRCEICSKLTIKTPDRRQREICSMLIIKTSKWRHWHRSGVFIVNFQNTVKPVYN